MLRSVIRWLISELGTWVWVLAALVGGGVIVMKTAHNLAICVPLLIVFEGALIVVYFLAARMFSRNGRAEHSENNDK